jgi:hypothetical protein
MKKNATTISSDSNLFVARPCGGRSECWCVDEIEFRVGRGACWLSTFYEPVKPRSGAVGMTEREAKREAKRKNEGLLS